MPIGDFCKRDVVVTDRNATVMAAARLMRDNHVGAVVVGDANGRPVGIVTDRDMVVEVLACGLDPETILVEDIMLESLHTVSEREGVFYDHPADARTRCAAPTCGEWHGRTRGNNFA